MTRDERVTATAVIAAIVVVAGLVTVLLGIGGSYLLTLHALHVQEATQEALKVREATAQIRTSVPTCRALQSMDDARTSLSPRYHPGPYVQHLANAIHRVYASTRCQVILTGLARHEPLTEILKQLGGG